MYLPRKEISSNRSRRQRRGIVLDEAKQRFVLKCVRAGPNVLVFFTQGVDEGMRFWAQI